MLNVVFTYKIDILMRNPNAAHIDFTELKGLFGTKSPSDIDMILRSGNRFLICEWKRGPKEKPMYGQELLLRFLSKNPSFTVLIAWGNTDNGMVVDKFFKVNFKGPCIALGSGLQSFKDYLVKWENGKLQK